MESASAEQSVDRRRGENETRRRYYLQALGVDLYYPRQALAGAKASSPVKPLPFESSLEVVTPLSSSVSAEVDLSTKSAANELIQTPIKAEAKKVPSKKLDIELETASKTRKDKNNKLEIVASKPSTASVRFTLRVWRISNQILIVDSRDAELALPTDTLLRNIVVALGFNQNEISKSETLRWPLMRYTDPVQSELDAKAMVQAFIEAQQQKHGFTTVFLLGENSARFALSAKENDEKETNEPPDNTPPDKASNQSKTLWKTIELVEACVGIVLPSLADLLQEPDLKKKTWQCIRHLKK